MRIAVPVLSAILCAASAGAVMAQADPTASPPAPVADGGPTPVEEAVVEAPKPDPDPEICRREMPTGSRIAVKVCKPKSAWVAKSTRSRRIDDPQHIDGFDDKLAPLPPSE